MKPRIKHGQLPGDIGKCRKIAMREGRDSDKKRGKNFKKIAVIAKERAVLKERTRKEIDRQIEDGD